MKRCIATILIFASMNVLAQESEGIKFENNLTWKGILEKAKKENKFIFLDGYTTWCAPCKQMATEVFTVKEVGSFFNEKFINIAVQFDSSSHSRRQVRKWYKDAQMMHQQFDIHEYPTFLFFNPNGDLVTKLVGATFDPQAFVEKAKTALSPKTQLVSLKKQFDAGRKDTVFLLTLIELSEKANSRSNLPLYINQFLQTQADLLAPRNIALIAKGTEHSTDIGYPVLKMNASAVEPVIGVKERLRILETVAFDEDIMPVIYIEGKKTNMGGMVMYSGKKLVDSVDWVKVNFDLNHKYDKNLSAKILLNGKLKYYSWGTNWDNYNKTLLAYSKNENIDTDLIESEAWRLATLCHDLKFLEQALDWAIVLNDDQYKNKYQQTYGRLLYKAGKKTAGIEAMKKYRSSLSAPSAQIDDSIRKMENGEKID